MPKRKRSHREREEVDTVQEIQLKKEQVENKLVHGKKVLNRALKTARGFERQKLSKRIKLAAVKQDGGEEGRLQRELDVLKILDLSVAVEAHLFKTLLKSRSIHESGLLPEYVISGIKWNNYSPEELVSIGNVTARLYNSKPVKEAIAHILGSTYALIGVQDPSITKKNEMVERVVLVHKEEDQAGSAGTGVEADINDRKSQSQAPNHGLLEVPTDLASRDNGPDPDETSELEWGGIHDTPGDYFSEEEINEDVGMGAAIGHSNTHFEVQEKVKDTSSLFSSSSQSPSPPPKPKKSKKHAQQGSSKPGSTFLPTLMGGYWSGSESATDEEEISTQKKNRPGQQARRALWEKKFGGRANHLRGQASGKSRDKDWDPRRGARGVEDGRFTRGRAAIRGGGSSRVKNMGQSTGENSVALKPRARGMGRKDDAGPLHPSWEAAKKAKEAKQTASFQGKRVVFE